MKDHRECVRGFTQLSKAWYADANLRGDEVKDELMIGFYHPQGGTTGEFGIRWEWLSGKYTPKLTSYDDSWSALFEFRDVLEKLAEIDGEDREPDEVVAILEACGIKNMTQTVRGV